MSDMDEAVEIRGQGEKVDQWHRGTLSGFQDSTLQHVDCHSSGKVDIRDIKMQSKGSVSVNSGERLCL